MKRKWPRQAKVACRGSCIFADYSEKEKFGVGNTLKVFLCSDFTLTDAEILERYTHRWKIEVMFKQQKRYLGLKSFMIRTATAIDRFRIILTVAWFF